MSSVKKAVSILEKAKADIAKALQSEHPAHALRLSSALDREINYITLITGTAIDSPAAKAVEKLGAATTIAGEPIVVATAGAKTEDLQPEQSAVEILKAAVETVYGKLLSLDSKEALKDYDDLVLRGVAKKAGLKVTKDEPAKLTVKFIDEVKAAITKQTEEHRAKVQVAESNLESAVEVLNQLHEATPTIETDSEAANQHLENIAKQETLVAEAKNTLDQLKAQA